MKKVWSRIRPFALIAAAVLSVRFLLPVFFPLLLSFLCAAWLSKATDALAERTGIGRRLASASVCAVFIAVGGLLLAVLAWRIISAVSGVAERFPEMFSAVRAELEERLYGILVSLPPDIRGVLTDAVSKLADGASELPGKLMADIPALTGRIASEAPMTVLGIFTFIIGIFFMGASYPEIKSSILSRLSAHSREKLGKMKSCSLKSLRRWLLAQLILCAVTFSVLSAALLAIKTENAVLIAAGISLVDMLPVLGTGVILLPWALIKLLTGDGLIAAILAASYLAAAVIRNVLEPKLLGGGSNVAPWAMLTAMYTGARICGVAGMLLFPFGLTVIKALCDDGVIEIRGKNETDSVND